MNKTWFRNRIDHLALSQRTGGSSNANPNRRHGAVSQPCLKRLFGASGARSVRDRREPTTADRRPMPSNVRTETDSFGPIAVPADAYWGAQTERSIGNFPFGPREQMPLEIVHALGFVKQAAARVNARIGLLDPEIAEAIQQAAAEVARGDLDGQFPLVVWQTGSGTQSNMNANEVIAGRANEILTGKRGGKEPVHPNDHVNKSQSSNDSFPTAMHIAAARSVRMCLLPALAKMHARLADQAQRWNSSVKIGRTHLQDATPLTLGQEFSGYAAQVEDCIDRIQSVMPRVLRLAQGGTAVGT